MTFLLFLISVAVLDQLLLRRQPARKSVPESETAPPKSKAAGSGAS